MHTPRAIAFDLDDTLVESKQPLSPHMGSLLARLLERMPVAIMSGEHFPQFEKNVLPGIPAEAPLGHLYLFPANASVCYTFEDGAWRKKYEEMLSGEEKHRIRNAFTIALMDSGLADETGQTWGELVEDRGSQISYSGLGQEAPLEPKKAWDPDRTKRMKLRDFLQPLLPEYSVRVAGLTTVDVTKKHLTKAYGVRKFSEYTGIPIADMVYIGDKLMEGGNDEVVKETGIPTVPVRDCAETAKIIESYLESPAGA